MRSRTPKVLHSLCGRPMIDLVLESCRAVGPQSLTVVVSPAQQEVVDHLRGRCSVVFQERPLGTGDALARVPAEQLARGEVLVVNGDQPLIRPETIRRLLAAHRDSGAAATLATVEDPSRADGRVLRRPDGSLDRIVEDRDAGPKERATTEVNVGLYCFRGADLVEALGRLHPDNAAGELYLTDLFQHLRPTRLLRLEDPEEAIGVNDRLQLARAEAALRRRLLERLMRSGVTVRDPASTFVDMDVEVGADTVLEPFTVLRGRTVIGEGCRIGPFVWIEDAVVGDGSDCGPFSRLRAGTRIAPEVHIGSFAELVRSSVGRGSAVPHVSYLGDANLGERVNVGAGTITANYDGRSKHPTVIEDDCFVGVDTMFVAPRRMGRGAKTGAGAVVTKDIPPGTVAVGAPARAIKRREQAE